MNRLYTTILAATALTFTAAAQQLPNAGFEEGSVTCYPWSSTNPSGPFEGNNNVGTTPKNWCVSNVYTGISNQTTGEVVENGYSGSSNAVKLTDKKVDMSFLGIKQVIPAYMTLGTSWSTSKGYKAEQKDGGCWGGLSFQYKPDALSIAYKRNAQLKSSVIAYLWKGTFKQVNVPANVVVSGSPTTVSEMINRDRVVLGKDMTGLQGGEVTDKGTLIASFDTAIEGENNSDTWKEFIQEFTYHNNESPEMINVIISAGDYYDDSKINGNTFLTSEITVDNIKLVYYSRLKSLSVNGTAVADFDPNTYEYNVDAEMPTNASAIVAECLGNSGSGNAVVALDAANNKATITVTNTNADLVGRASSDVTDIDGQTSHVYTLTFKSGEDEKDPNTREYPGNLEIKLGDEVVKQDATVQIIPNADLTSCTFILPNFSFSGLSFGDLRVENVKMTHANGVTSFDGEVKNLILHNDAMDVDADVNVTGTCDAEGNLIMKIDVIWHSGEDNFGDFPIYVTFNGKGDAFGTSAIGGIESDVIDENVPVEYYNIQGVKVNGDNLAPGFYIVRQGKKVSKIFVK